MDFGGRSALRQCAGPPPMVLWSSMFSGCQSVFARSLRRLAKNLEIDESPTFPSEGLIGPWLVLGFTAKDHGEQADSSEGLRREACSHTQSQSYKWDTRTSRYFLRLLRGVAATNASSLPPLRLRESLVASDSQLRLPRANAQVTANNPFLRILAQSRRRMPYRVSSYPFPNASATGERWSFGAAAPAAKQRSGRVSPPLYPQMQFAPTASPSPWSPWQR